MPWLWLALLAHALNAIAFVVDKILITKTIPNPVAYTFYIGVLGLLALLLYPFGVAVPGMGQFGIDLVAGASFSVALFLFFSALRRMETSRVVTLIGALSPVGILVLSRFLIGEQFAVNQWIAFALLVAGGVVVTIERNARGQSSVVQRTVLRISPGLVYALSASLFFALSLGLAKFAYTREPFLSSFVWQRAGAGALVLLFLLIPTARRAIARAKGPSLSFKLKAIFLGNQALGAAGGILLNIAVALGSATFVQALQGVQYAFLFLLVVILSKKFPHLLHERLTAAIVTQKVVAVMIIGAGLALLAQS